MPTADSPFPFPKKDLPPPTLGRVLKPALDDYVHFEHGDELPFAWNQTTFSRLNAWWLADAALLAYWPPDEAKRRCEGVGFTRVEPLEDDAVGTQGFVAIRDEGAIVSFRGTEPDALKDLLTDAAIRLDPWIGGGRAHQGFQGGLAGVWPRLADLLGALGGRPAWFTGHSLGAALATLAADRMLLELGAQPAGVYTIGSPMLGDRTFAERFDARHHGRSFRYVNDRDGVATLPPAWIGYRHVAEERFAGFDDPHVLNVLENLIDHTPRRYAVLLWNALVDEGVAAGV